MKPLLKYSLLGILVSILALNASAQKPVLQKSIYFESAKYDLTTSSKTLLDALCDSLKNYSFYKIVIKGNTDAIGDSLFNKKLAAHRVSATQQYFISKGILPAMFSSSAVGEEKPIGDNSTEEGKQKNRRVDISVFYTKAVPIDSSVSLSSIWELYKQTERKLQAFCINPVRDTVLRCEKGTIVYVKANSFKTITACKTTCVTLKVKEDFLKSDMILDNLSTTSNGKIIETQGMVYTEASDCKGNKTNLVKGKDLVIMQPTDKIVPGAKIFQGNRTAHDSIMNWTVNNHSVLSHFTLSELNLCNDWLCGGVVPCPFFFCKIKRFFRKLIGRKETNRILPLLTKDAIKKCETLDKLYKDYGVKNLNDLINSINKPLLDSFKVKTIAELQDTMRQLNLSKIELSYLNKSLSYEDFNYYVYNTSRLGWSNVDVFADLKGNELVKMKINLNVAKNIDCKLVFKNRRFVIPYNNEGKKYLFDKIPKGEPVWVIAMKYDEGKPYLFMQETETDNKTLEVDFKLLTLEELKEKLKVLDQ